MLSVDIQAWKSGLCSSVHLSQIVVWYSVTGLLKSPCTAHQPDEIHLVQIHLIGIRNSPDHCRVRNKADTRVPLFPVPWARLVSLCTKFPRRSLWGGGGEGRGEAGASVHRLPRRLFWVMKIWQIHNLPLKKMFHNTSDVFSFHVS